MAPTKPQFIQRHAFNKRSPFPQNSTPEAPPAPSTRSDGFSPSAIIAIVAAIVILLVTVPLIAILLRRYERKRCVEMLPDSAPGSSNNSVSEDQSLKSILVTRELQRESLKVEVEVRRPDDVYKGIENGDGERGWRRTEVRGGDWQ